MNLWVRLGYGQGSKLGWHCCHDTLRSGSLPPHSLTKNKNKTLKIFETSICWPLLWHDQKIWSLFVKPNNWRIALGPIISQIVDAHGSKAWSSIRTDSIHHPYRGFSDRKASCLFYRQGIKPGNKLRFVAATNPTSSVWILIAPQICRPSRWLIDDWV